MARYSREGQYKIEQRIGESPDAMLIRGFAKLLPHMKRRHAIAAANWMIAYASDYSVWKKIRAEKKTARLNRIDSRTQEKK